MSKASSLQKLSGITIRFLHPLSPEDTYAILLKEAEKMFGTSGGSIFLRFHKKWYRVYSTIAEEKQITPRSTGFSYLTLQTRVPTVISKEKFLKSHPQVKNYTEESLLLVPLYYNNESIGIIALRSAKKKKLTKSLMQALQLYGSLATLAIKKTQLYEESKEAVRMRDLFISLAAHELRTPLTTINAYVHLLRRKLRATNFPYMQWVQELSAETSHIIRLVNELLNVDLIQHGAFSYRMQPLMIGDLVQHAVREFSLAYPFYAVRIESDVRSAGKIMADPDKLLQMFSSLLQNAAKFSSPQDAMIVGIHETRTSYAISIQDMGIGILSKDIRSIFKGFYKGSNNSQDGIGLGLFLSKRIVEKHSGKIAIVSEKNKGTTVTVTLPKLSL